MKAHNLKNEHILDCSNRESTIHSLSKILKIDKQELIKALLSICPNTMMTTNIIWESLIRKVDVGEIFYDKVIWFHGTRTPFINSYNENGILPTKDIFSKINHYLSELNKQIFNDDIEITNINSGPALASKLSNQYSGGPFAYLIREFHFKHLDRSYDYFKIPEILSDCIHSSSVYKRRSNQIMSLYSSFSKKYIIKFFDTNTDEYYVKTAIRYIYNEIHNIDHDEHSNTCFDNSGVKVLPNQIIDIEEIK